MKKIYTLLAAVFVLAYGTAHAQTTVCDSTGNVIIYSNYDGGVLNINVDQNIANLKIGVVSYEPVTINISGTYAANVTEVRYAGYVATTNMHCNNSPTTTTIVGAGSAVTSVNFLPAATYSNPNGYSMIVCNYSCSTTSNQGGCNTADQVAHYFLTNFGGTMRYHFTQYGCWSGTMNVSAGGNCCANPLATGVHASESPALMTVSPNPSAGDFHITFASMTGAAVLEVKNVLGETVFTTAIAKGETVKDISLTGMADGMYVLHFVNGTSSTDTRIVIRN